MRTGANAACGTVMAVEIHVLVAEPSRSSAICVNYHRKAGQIILILALLLLEQSITYHGCRT